MHPKELSIKNFTYTLPDEQIAKYPLANRDESRLLIYQDGIITEDTYKHVAQHLSKKSLLVFNNTKVVEARLIFHKSNGTPIELFCLEPSEIYTDITAAMLSTGNVVWKCLVGGAKKWKENPLVKIITRDQQALVLTAINKEKRNDHFLIEFSWNDATLSFAEVLHLAGSIPLPPYLKRDTEHADMERYQTIYAKHNGSVAAPTAGLHFTDSIFQDLASKKIDTDFVTLHVGAGTFKPVKADIMQAHEMHAEHIEISQALITNIIQHLSTGIVAVGTTSLRTIESLYWLGVKTILESKIDSKHLHITQWEPYELRATNISASDALHALLNWMEWAELQQLVTKTQIIMAPGYSLKIADALITNFHQPQSTLLLLVASIIGDDWEKIYGYALENNFRFLSYGDGCLIRKP